MLQAKLIDESHAPVPALVKSPRWCRRRTASEPRTIPCLAWGRRRGSPRAGRLFNIWLPLNDVKRVWSANKQSGWSFVIMSWFNCGKLLVLSSPSKQYLRRTMKMPPVLPRIFGAFPPHQRATLSVYKLPAYSGYHFVVIQWVPLQTSMIIQTLFIFPSFSTYWPPPGIPYDFPIVNRSQELTKATIHHYRQ